MPVYRKTLIESGLGYVVDSFSTHPEIGVQGARRYGEVIASRWPLAALSTVFAVPWPERVLGASLASDRGQVEVYAAYIPCGASHGWTKVETLEGLYLGLAVHSSQPRILCGDFNTPKQEIADGTVVTWGGREGRWDRAERDILLGLAAFDLVDTYRLVNGYSQQDFSWFWRGKGRAVGRRFDHIFAAQRLNPRECSYLHELRLQALSDHSPLGTMFEWSSVQADGLFVRTSVATGTRHRPFYCCLASLAGLAGGLAEDRGTPILVEGQSWTLTAMDS